MTGLKNDWTINQHMVHVDRDAGEWTVDGRLVRTSYPPPTLESLDWGVAVTAWQQAATESFRQLNKEVRVLRGAVGRLKTRVNAFTKPLAKAPPARQSRARSSR